MSRIIIVFFVVCLPIYLNVPIFADEYSLDFSSIKELITGQPDDRTIRDNIDNIEDVIKEDPKNYEAYSMLAFGYDYLELYAKALEARKLEIKYAPEKEAWDIIYGNLARAYLSLGRIDEAKKPILKSLKYNPENIISHIHLLSFYVLKKQYKEAASEFKILSELDKSRDFYHEIYAWRFDNDKDLKDMVTLFEEAVKINPDSYLAHRVLGIAVRDSSGDIEKNISAVMKSLNKALELNPKYVPTYIAIANTYMYIAVATKKKAYYNDSLRWIDKAYKLAPKDLKLAYAAGHIYLNMGQYNKAIEKFEYAYYGGDKYENVLQSLTQAYNQKAYISHYKTGINLNKGLETIDKAIMLNPNDAIILSTKAELLYKMKRFKEAYEYIKKSLELDPNNPEVKEDLVNIEKALKEAKK
ncbi:MAG: tetratricopeptide repeat protein [Candidatus Omnitrophica bacterium]|nr:tetratricopeptide repeat protein [Candidatus Omnitrophota bacterium]